MRLLLVLNSFDKSFVNFFRPLVYGNRVQVLISNQIQTAAQLSQFVKDNEIEGIICSGDDILSMILKHNSLTDDKPTYGHWMGSLLKLDDIPLIFIQPLSHLTKVPEAEFVMTRFISKLTQPEKWQRVHELRWELANESANYNDIRELMKKAVLISIDIETFGNSIRCCGFTGIFIEKDKSLSSYTVCVPMDSFEQYLLIKDICENPSKKIMQNGNYDSTYLLRYSIPVNNYLFDTYHLMHSWMVELPKELGFISAFFLYDFVYWKYEANSNNLSDLYFYNAKDCHTTAWAFIAMINEMPEWAWVNYTLEFPKVFPAISCGMDGIKCDNEERMRLHKVYTKKSEDALDKLRRMIDKDFNPNSPKQVMAMMKALGEKKVDSSDEKALVRFADKHPINALIVEAILEYRGAIKLISTYLEFLQLNGRIMYALNPAGTDTGRFASKTSNFSETTTNTKGRFVYSHYGMQIQNVPVDVKSMFVTDSEKEKFAEVDFSQSESRTTAYLTEDAELINTVEHSPDFHCQNASLFFGIPFEELFDAVAHKVLNKPIRTLSKRVNHGANYLMGPWKLWQTMGDKNVRHAQQLLKLPRKWRPTQVTEYLLGCFDKSYPRIHGQYMEDLIMEVRLTKALVLPCVEFPWVRMTFLKPYESKLDKNACMAHKPQSLSGMKANDAFYEVWKELQINQKRIRVKAPIHDSIFFAYIEGDEKVVDEVRLIMEKPMTVNGTVMRIPADAKFGAATWAETKD